MIGACLNTNLPEIKALLSNFNNNELTVAKIMDEWDKTHEIDTIPTVQEAIDIYNTIITPKQTKAQDKLIEELSNVETEKIVKTVDEFVSTVSKRLRKLIKNENFKELKELFVNADKVNEYESVSNILREANKELKDLEDKEGIIKKIRAIVLTISQTDKFLDLMSKNVDNIIKDTPNAFENMKTLLHHLQLLNEWKLMMSDAKSEFSKSPLLKDKLSVILGKIDEIDKKILDADVLGMVSALKPYLSSVSPKYLKPFEERKAYVEKALKTVKNPEQKKRYETELVGLNKKIKEYDLTQDENIAAYLRGERGDTSFPNAFLEAFIDSTNPIVSSFTAFLKDSLRPVISETNTIEVEYGKELEETSKVLGNRFNPETLGKQLTTIVTKVFHNGEEYQEVQLLNKWSGTETVKIEGEEIMGGYEKIKQIFDNKEKAYIQLIKDGVDVEENKEKLSNLRKEYAIYRKNFMFQEFNDKYYEKYEKWGDELGRQLKEEVDAIFSEINKIQIPLTLGEELTKEDYEQIDALYKGYILLGSYYTADGIKKSPKDLEKAKRMREIRDLNREIYKYTPNPQAFEKAKTKYSEQLLAKRLTENSEEYKEKMSDWEYLNTVDVVSDTFWKLKKAYTDEIAELSEDLQVSNEEEYEDLGSIKSNWDTILESVYGHRDENNQPIGTEMIGEQPVDIKQAMLNLEEIKAKMVKSSGLTKTEYKRLTELSQRDYHYDDLTNEELQELDTLKKKRKSTGQTEEEKKTNKAKANRLSFLFDSLNSMQLRIPTEYYIATFNSIAGKLGVSIDDLGNIEGKDVINSPKLRILLKDADFKKWFNENHIEVERWDDESKSYQKQWIRTFQWSKIKPSDPKYIERKPARKYSTREVKDEYKTGYDPITKTVELKEGVHIDNRGKFLPKPDKFVNKDYEKLSKATDPVSKALFKTLNIHQKYLLSTQKDLSNKNKLWLSIPRVYKEATERNINLLKKLLTRPSEIPEIIWNTIKAKFSLSTDYSQGEGNFKSVFADKYGNKFTSLPIKYTDPIEVENVSLDLYRSIMKYTISAKLNNKLKELSPVISSLKRLVKEPSFHPLDIYSRIKGKLEKSPKAETNTTAYAIDAISKRIFEGQEKKMELGENFEKVSNSFKFLTVLKSIMFDIPASIANILDAERENIINLSNGAVNAQNLAVGHKLFFSEYLPAFIAEYGKNKIGEKTLQSQMFDLFSFVQGHSLEDTVGEKYSQSAIKDALALNWIKNHRKWGEVFVQSVAALAHLNAVKITQTLPNGTTKTISLNEAYELDSKGVIKLKDGIDEEWNTTGSKTLEVIRRIEFSSRRIQGNYSSGIDKPESDTYTLYSIWFLMKRFFVQKALNRFAGNYKLTKYGIKVDPRFNINEGADTGYIAQMFNLISKEIEGIAVTGKWQTLSKQEKQALIKTAIDAAQITLAWFILHVLFGWDDDDKDRYDKLNDMDWSEAQGLYQSARFITEASTFYNLKQYKDFIFDSPMMAKTLSDYADLLKYTWGNMVGDDDSYYSKNYGLYEKGESKAKARLLKVLGAEKALKGISSDENQQVEDYLKMRAK